jgi:hypothetical protein
MDLAYFLNQRLSFVEYFHAHTTASFEGIKSKIEAGEPPYVDTRHPDNPDDEPAFFEEWVKANAAVTITGAACLDLLQSTFHAFLDEYMRHIGNKQVIHQLKKSQQKGWFGKYKVLFHDHLQIDWDASGADLVLLEQMILTRNEFTHNIDLLSLDAFQTPSHAEKYPNSTFADPRWKNTLFPQYEHTRLIVPGDTVQRAVEALRTLCEYLDRERYVLMKRRRAERKAQKDKSG